MLTLSNESEIIERVGVKVVVREVFILLYHRMFPDEELDSAYKQKWIFPDIELDSVREVDISK